MLKQYFQIGYVYGNKSGKKMPLFENRKAIYKLLDYSVYAMEKEWKDGHYFWTMWNTGDAFSIYRKAVDENGNRYNSLVVELDLEEIIHAFSEYICDGNGTAFPNAEDILYISSKRGYVHKDYNFAEDMLCYWQGIYEILL